MSDEAATPVGEHATRAGERRPLPRRILSHPLTHLFAALLLLGLTQAFVVKVGMVPSGSMEHALEVGDRLLVNRLAYTPLGSDRQPGGGDIVAFTTDDALWPKTQSDEQSGFFGAVKQGVKFVFGDLIGIGPPTDPLMVKRVIGVAGQTIECCGTGGQIVVDGVEVEEPYIFGDLPFAAGAIDCASTPRSQRCFDAVTVPEGMLLVLGDHRGNSSDGITGCRGVDASAAGASASTSASANASAGAGECVRWVKTDDVIGEAFAVIWPLNRFGGV